MNDFLLSESIIDCLLIAPTGVNQESHDDSYFELFYLKKGAGIPLHGFGKSEPRSNQGSY